MHREQGLKTDKINLTSYLHWKGKKKKKKEKKSVLKSYNKLRLVSCIYTTYITC